MARAGKPGPPWLGNSGPLGSLPGKEHGLAVAFPQKSLGIQPCAPGKLDLRTNEEQTEGGLLGPMMNAQVLLHLWNPQWDYLEERRLTVQLTG